MQARQLNTNSTDNDQQAYFAYLNARTINSANKSKFSDSARLAVTRASDLLSSLYCHTKPYVNYRKTKVAIKLCTKAVNNKKMLKEYEEYLEEQNWTKAVSAQGVVYSKKLTAF